MDYAVVWSIIIPLALLIYILLDGFDIGIGILFPFAKNTEQRDNMIKSIMPVWDSNETWLVLAAGGLYGIFPKAYTYISSTLYVPIMAMLIFIIFRGIAIEFRFKSSEKYKYIWSTSFFIGSLGIAIFQGMILAQFIKGFPHINVQQDYNLWDWAAGFNVLFACLFVTLYAFLGANYLIYKLRDQDQQLFISCAQRLKWMVLALFIGIGLSIFLMNNFWNIRIDYLSVNLKSFHVIGLIAIGALTLIHTHYTSSSKVKSVYVMPLIVSWIMTILGFVIIASLIWPYIVPNVYTIWQASSLPETQKFMLGGALVCLPLILGCLFFNFYVFRGKISTKDQTY